MKKRILSFLVVMLAFAFVVVSCQRKNQEQPVTPEGGDNAAVQENTPVEEPANNVVDKSKDVFAKVKDYTFDKKADFVAWVKGKSDKYNEKIAEVEKKLDSADEQAKEQYKATIDYLKEKKSQLDESIKELDNVSEDKWEETKENVANVIEDMKQAFDDLKN
jgi:chromosome segregation ATPase